jgi:hypothetical protein
MNPILEQIIKDLETSALDAAKHAAAGFIPAATEDAKSFLKLALPSLERWFGFYTSKAITADEFKCLLFGLKDLASMNALTVSGLALIEVDKVKNTMLSAVTQIATGAITKLI